MGVSSCHTAEPGVPKASRGLAQGATKMKVPISPWNTPTPQALRDNGGVVSTPAQVRVSNLFMTFNKTQTSPHWRLIKESIGSEHSEVFTLRDCDQGVGMRRTGTQGQQGQAPLQTQSTGGLEERKSRREGMERHG